MTRRDDYLDAMLRELGAAYYCSLHDKADKADVARALAPPGGAAEPGIRHVPEEADSYEADHRNCQARRH
jgi:hypothetical protein